MMLDLTRYWYRDSLHGITVLLMPVSWLFGAIAMLRRMMYRKGIFKTIKLSVPVIVVGNITTGGTGKTPLVIWLAEILTSQGYRPGIVSRGVGGVKHREAYVVRENSTAQEVGDEALLLAQRTGCKVVVSLDRVAAAKWLLAHTDCNIIISDDGLQHYRLGRDIEIAVVDGARQFGNQQLLPAGPLREPVSRLKQVDFVVENSHESTRHNSMRLAAMSLQSLKSPDKRVSLADFSTKHVHAIAAIGNPERFFTTLKNAGFTVIPHVFPDHYIYNENDLNFNDDLPIIMTEKDAVKCVRFAKASHWYLPVTAKLSAEWEKQFTDKLNTLERKHHAEEDFSKRPCNRLHP